MKPEHTFPSSFRYAAEGITAAFREGRNIRIQALIALIAVIAGFSLAIEAWEWVAVIVCIGAVIGAEIFNTAIEDVVDLASPGFDLQAKSAKDMAAAAVLVFSAASFAVGIIVFGGRLAALLGWG